MQTELNKKQFYKELGRLLYAIAISDNKIQGKEIETLHEFVSKELALSEPSSDSSGMNKAFYTNFEFEEAAKKNLSMEEAYHSFMHFLDANIMKIDTDLLQKTVTAIEKLAGSFRKTNEQEKKLIKKIKSEIRAITTL